MEKDVISLMAKLRGQVEGQTCGAAALATPPQGQPDLCFVTLVHLLQR